MPWNISKLSNTGDLQFAYFYAPAAKKTQLDGFKISQYFNPYYHVHIDVNGQEL